MLLPELEIKCWKCWGQGFLAAEDHGDMMDCPECGGIGWVPTEEGRRLLEFLERHLVLASDEREDQESEI